MGYGLPLTQRFLVIPSPDLRTKDYGYCTETGDPICYSRPSAQPAAQARTHVQGREEKVKKCFRS